MGSDVNSKHGLIIGFFTVALTLPNIIESIFYHLDSIHSGENYYRIDYVITAIGLLSSISGCLLMLGIAMNYQYLLVPWLVTELIWSTYFVFCPTFHFEVYQLILLLFGLQTLLFYPICNLYIEIRRWNAALNAHSRH